MISITKEEIVRRLREIADGIESEELHANEYSQTVKATITSDRYDATIIFTRYKDESI